MLVYLPIQNIRIFLFSLVLHHLPDVASFCFFFGLLVCFPTLVNVLFKNSYHLLRTLPFQKDSFTSNKRFTEYFFCFWLKQSLALPKGQDLPRCLPQWRLSVASNFTHLRADREVCGLSLLGDAVTQFLLFPHREHALKLIQVSYHLAVTLSQSSTNILKATASLPVKALIPATTGVRSFIHHSVICSTNISWTRHTGLGGGK